MSFIKLLVSVSSRFSICEQFPWQSRVGSRSEQTRASNLIVFVEIAAVLLAKTPFYLDFHHKFSEKPTNRTRLGKSVLKPKMSALIGLSRNLNCRVILANQFRR